MVVWKNALMPSTIHISVHIRGDRESCTTIYSNWKGYRKELGGSANILRNLQGSGRGSILWSLYLINTPLVTFFLEEKNLPQSLLHTHFVIAECVRTCRLRFSSVLFFFFNSFRNSTYILVLGTS